MLFCFLRLIFFFRGSISMFYKFWGCFFSISEYCNPIKLICDKLVPFLHVLLKFLNVLVQFQLADLYLGLIKIHLSFRNLNLRIKEGLMIQIEDIFTAKCTFLLITGCCVSLLFFHKIRSELHIFQYIYQLPVLYNQDVKIILESLLIKLQAFNTDIFLWILRSFYEGLFWRTSANGYF